MGNEPTKEEERTGCSRTGCFVSEAMKGVSGPAAKASEAALSKWERNADPGIDIGSGATLTLTPKEASSRTPPARLTQRRGAHPHGGATEELPTGKTVVGIRSVCDISSDNKQVPLRSEQTTSATLEVSTVLESRMVSVPGGSLPITAGNRSIEKPGADGAEGLPNGHRRAADESPSCNHQRSSSARPNKSADSDRLATTPRLGDLTRGSGSREGIGTPSGFSPIATPFAAGIDARSCSTDTSGGEASAFPSVSARSDRQPGAVKRSNDAPVVATALDRCGSVAPVGPTAMMATEENVQLPRATVGCLIEQEKVYISPRDDNVSTAVKCVEEASALRANGARPSADSPSASPRSESFFRGRASGAPVPSVARATEDADATPTETSTSVVVTHGSDVAVTHTPRAPTESCRDITRSGPTSSFEVSRESLAVDSVGCSSTERQAPMSGNRRARGLEEERTGFVSMEQTTAHDSPGDTVDIALAALLYADAVTGAGGIVDPTSTTVAAFENGGASKQTQSVSNNGGGGSSRSAALGNNATAAIAADNLAMSPIPSREREEGRTVSAATVPPSVTTQPASKSLSNDEEASQVFEASSENATVSASGITRPLGSNGVTKASRKRGASASDHHDDMMHAMCMICLEKLSDVAEGGGAKLLGLLDACSHRYCYTCILEWSKITNKCPQCKARFHTIKAIKELRRNKNRYRGVAVRVKDRDQVYSFVDVRDVVVLDPDVACHVGCLVRRGVDAFRQGWEFSVQCEQCSNWYHGLCVGFRQEWEVPDIWFCRPCRGESYQIVLDPDAITEPAAIVARSRASPGGNNRSVREQSNGRSSEGHDGVPPSVLGQEISREVARYRGQVPQQVNGNGGAPLTSRTVQDDGQGTGERSEDGRGSADVAVPPQTPAMAPSTHVQSSRLPPVAAEARGEGAGSPTSPIPDASPWFDAQRQALATPPPAISSPSPPPPVRATSAPPLTPPVVAPPSRSRGRPRGSRNKPVPSRPLLAQSLASPQEQTPASPPPTRAHGAPSPTLGVAAAPARGRGRPRGSKNKPPGQPPTQSPAQPPSEPQLGISLSPPFAAPSTSPSQENDHQHHEEQAQSSSAVLLVTGGASDQDVHPQPPEPPAPSFLRSLEDSNTCDLCEVCGFDTEPDNLIVYCESCNMGVHQTCYGISEIPTKEWYCGPCSAGVHPSTLSCRFCPVKGGALKRCTDGSWGHILCAFWIPECCFIDPQKMEPIGSINRKGQPGGVEKFLPPFRSRKCHVCGTNAGSAIRCHSPSCKFHLHPMCGSKAGSVYMEIETTMKRGADGTEHESVNLVARCPRHNKSKTDERLCKGRSAVASAADPLSVIGKTLEIRDPERDGAIALAGKVTWFDSHRSRYCIVASRNVDCSDGSGGGETKEGCSHWITMDKLIEAKAMGVHKSGKTFVLEPLRSGGKGMQMDTESGHKNNREVMGQIEGEKAGEDSSVLLEKDDPAALEEMRSHQDDVGTVERRGNDSPPPPTSSSDARAGCTALLEVQTRHAMGARPPQPESEASYLPCSLRERPQSSTASDVRAESETGGTGSSTEIEGRRTSARQVRLLPSVQLAEQPDLFSRYPIRGRLKRPTDLALDLKERGKPSTKRQRLEGEPDQGVIGALDARSRSSCTVGPVWPGETIVAGAADQLAPSGDGGGVKSRLIPQVCPSTGMLAASAAEVESRESGPACVLEPGWPHGMQLLGQVPVMHVRAVCVPGGGVAAFYASAYTRAEKDVVDDMRSTQRFSFLFEDFEETNLADRRQRILRQQCTVDVVDDHPKRSCQPDRASEGQEGEDTTQDDAGNKEVQHSMASPAQRVGEPGHEENNQAKEEREETKNYHTHVSACRDDVEDGEVVSDVQAVITHPGPRRELNRDDDSVERTPGKGVQVAEEGAGSKDFFAQTALHSNQSSMTSVDNNETKAMEIEQMEVSTDEDSFCGYQGAEAASPCISDDEDDISWGVSGGRGDSLETGSELPMCSPNNMEMRGRFPEGTDCAVEESTSATDTVSKHPRSSDETPIESAEAAEKALPDACAEAITSRQHEVFAVEQEMAVVQPLAHQQTGETLALRSIVREQLQGVLRSASKGEEAEPARGNGNDVLEQIAGDAEEELFRRLYKDSTGGREYKAKYKQLLLSLGNVRNYRLVASVLAGHTTPVDLATKDAVGLLNSLSSSLNCLATPLAGRHRQGSPPGKGHKGKGQRRGKMQLL